MLKNSGKFGHIYRFPVATGHWNNHIGEADSFSKPLDERVVGFLKTQIRDGCKWQGIKKLQHQATICVYDSIFANDIKPLTYRRKIWPYYKKIT